MPMLVRTRSNRNPELRLTHKLLDKAVYRTFDSEDEATREGERALKDLDRGTIPAWLISAVARFNFGSSTSSYQNFLYYFRHTNGGSWVR